MKRHYSQQAGPKSIQASQKMPRGVERLGQEVSGKGNMGREAESQVVGNWKDKVILVTYFMTSNHKQGLEQEPPQIIPQHESSSPSYTRNPILHSFFSPVCSNR